MIFGSSAPVIGARRERVVFAWFPIALDDNRIAWLTRVRLLERGMMVHVPGECFRPPRDGERGYWAKESAVLP